MIESQHKIVSSEREQLILVDESDNEIGHLSKAECHDGQGVLHRAFSVFLFDRQGRLLLQRRSMGKRLWPGYWSNSCCSHPRRGESMALATERRVHEELGVTVELQYVYRFRYQAQFGEAGSEHELCSVFLGRCPQPLKPNRTEIDEIRFVSAVELSDEMTARPSDFTPWIQQEWSSLNREHAAVLRGYLEAT